MRCVLDSRPLAGGPMAETGGERLVKVPETFAKKARRGSLGQYRAPYDRSLSDSDRFWAEQAERLNWFKRWDKVSRADFKEAKIEWFIGGKINASANCLDRPLAGPRKNKAALIWEGDSPDESRTLTSQDVYRATGPSATGPKQLRLTPGPPAPTHLPTSPPS